ncbi:MAG: hypothetical protein MR034_09645, partial [Actinobacillus porcinus]
MAEFELEQDVLEAEEVIETAESEDETLDNFTALSPFATPAGVERGKFRSLTLINWNGFFARTFDLDELVTTLS